MSSYTMNPATLKKVAENELGEIPKTRKRALRGYAIGSRHSLTSVAAVMTTTSC